MWFSIAFISTSEKIGMDLERQAADFKFDFFRVKGSTLRNITFDIFHNILLLSSAGKELSHLLSAHNV